MKRKDVDDTAADAEFALSAYLLLPPVAEREEAFGERIKWDLLTGIKFEGLEHESTFLAARILPKVPVPT